jgi:hypothetical protein
MLPMADSGVAAFIEKMKRLHVCGAGDDSRKTPCTHGATEQAEVVPYAVAHNVHTAPSPQQQSVLQQPCHTADEKRQEVTEYLKRA